MSYRIVPNKQNLKQIATDAGRAILLRIANDVVRIARASTIKAKGPAAPNKPPHEHFGDLDRSIAVSVDESTGRVLVGPRESIIGQRGNILEFAGTYDPTAGRDKFGRFLTGHASRTAPSGARRAHPFMRPAFNQAIAEFTSGTTTNSSFT